MQTKRSPCWRSKRFCRARGELSELGTRCIELRQAADLKQDFDRLVLPGGESTVQGKLLDELGMLEELRARIVEGMPSWAPAPA